MAFTYNLYLAMERKVVPGLRYSQDVYQSFLARFVPSADWLDIGCGWHILSPWKSADEERNLISSAKSAWGIDPDASAVSKHRSLENLRIGDCSTLPFPDSSFDLITANMVVEHLSDPERQFREVLRVLKPGGVFLFHTPNVRGYHSQISRLLSDRIKKLLALIIEGRAGADVYPTYYLANCPEDIQHAAAGFTDVEILPLISSATLQVIPPFALLELLWLRILSSESFAHLRPCLIVTMKKPS